MTPPVVLEITSPDDMHHHLRDGDVLKDVLKHAGKVYDTDKLASGVTIIDCNFVIFDYYIYMYIYTMYIIYVKDAIDNNSTL